jgi:peroxiredoxin
LIFASVDSEEKTEELRAKLGLSLPLAYGLDCRAVSREAGAFFEEEKSYLHATGFLLEPDGKILNACYATGPLGRLAAEQVLALVRYYKSLK